MNDLSAEPGRLLGERAHRSVHRAIGELRRGIGVLLTGERELVVLAAETVSMEAIAEAGVVAGDGRVDLVVSSGRLLHDGPSRLTAFKVASSAGDLASRSAGWMRDLADPTRGETAADLATSFERVDLPWAADAALALIKLARLSPAALLIDAGGNAGRHAASSGAASSGAASSGAASSGMVTTEEAAVLAFSRETALSLAIVAEASVPLEDADEARLVAFRAPDGGIEHLAVVIGDPGGRAAPLVRLHSECFTGDFLGSLRCDCGDQLRGAIRRMRDDGAGVLLYLAQEGRGIGLVNKLRAYSLQDRGLDTLDANRALGWDADERSFTIAATMLRLLGIGRVKLLTNNPDKVEALTALGIEIVERVGQVVAPNGVNDDYLATKRRRFGHLLG